MNNTITTTENEGVSLLAYYLAVFFCALFLNYPIFNAEDRPWDIPPER